MAKIQNIDKEIQLLQDNNAFNDEFDHSSGGAADQNL